MAKVRTCPQEATLAGATGKRRAGVTTQMPLQQDRAIAVQVAAARVAALLGGRHAVGPPRRAGRLGQPGLEARLVGAVVGFLETIKRTHGR